MSLNKVQLIGRIGRDAEMRYTPAGAAVCSVSVATSRSWNDKTTGERQEDTEWHRVVIFDRMAEVAGEMMKKGRQVYIEGRNKTRKWTDKNEVDRYSTEVIASEFTMLDAKPAANEKHDAPGGTSGASSQPSEPEDDIPF